MDYCFTVGYQGRSIDDLCSVLLDFGIKMLVDVRARAWSQRPEFRKEALRRALASVGVDYIHLKTAGNPFRPRKGVRTDFTESASRYRGLLGADPKIVEDALRLVGESDAAFFCYEAHFSECHRSVLIEEMRRKEPDLQVEHL